MGQGGAVGFANGGVAAGQGHVSQVGDAVKAGIVGDQKLAAPNGAIGAITGAVKRDPDDGLRPVQPVFCHTAGHVGMVMLDGDQLGGGRRAGRVILLPALRHAPRILGAQIARVHVIGDDFRLDAKGAAELLDHVFKGAQRLVILHIADVLAEKGIARPRQAKGVLEFGADSQGRAGLKGQMDGIGRIPARAAQGHFGALKDARHRVVATGVDGAVVHQKGVGQLPQPLQCLIVAGGNRFLGIVAAGHD